jgi:hypothetical protein
VIKKHPQKIKKLKMNYSEVRIMVCVVPQFEKSFV